MTTDHHYQVPELGLDLALDGPVLRGSLGGKTPLELRRTATLPADPPVPTRLPEGAGPRWRTQLGAPIWAAAAVRDHVAYVGTAGGVVNAIDTRDGHRVWTFAAGRPLFGEALATEDAVLVACDNGFLFALERATGQERWRYDLGDARVSRVLPHPAVFDYDHEAPAPVLADGVVYVGAGDGGFHAVSAASGERVWRFEAPGKIRATAAIQGDRVVLGTLDGWVIALARADGHELWRRDVKGAVTSDLVLLGDALIVGTRGSVLAALDPATGETRWKQSFWGSWVESTPTRPDGEIAYVGSSDLRRVIAFDPSDGRFAWRTDVFGWSWGAPVVTARSVYVATAGVEPYEIRHVASFTALDRATGKIRWRWPAPKPSGAMLWGFAAGAVLDGDTLVVGGLDGTLYAFPAS
ncbi:MAG: PQQ-binding-like beta-propeller repeat protein [Deltaproteobacteria bacterium]|nr:PQQ-binding-like beta-propeller repeat protein [Deltaproteobacteria bacterium]